MWGGSPASQAVHGSCSLKRAWAKGYFCIRRVCSGSPASAGRIAGTSMASCLPRKRWTSQQVTLVTVVWIPVHVGEIGGAGIRTKCSIHRPTTRLPRFEGVAALYGGSL